KLSTPSTAAPYVFTLNFNNPVTQTIQKTGPIASTATSANVLAALLAIPGTPFAPADLLVTGTATTGWTITFQGAFGNQDVPQLTTSGGTTTSPNNAPGLNVNVPAGQIGLAQSFDKDGSNGRHFFATNGGTTVAVATGSITDVAQSFNSINGAFPLLVT